MYLCFKFRLVYTTVVIDVRKLWDITASLTPGSTHIVTLKVEGGLGTDEVKKKTGKEKPATHFAPQTTQLHLRCVPLE